MMVGVGVEFLEEGNPVVFKGKSLKSTGFFVGCLG